MVWIIMKTLEKIQYIPTPAGTWNAMYNDISGDTSSMTFMLPAPGPSSMAGLFFIDSQDGIKAVTPDRIGIRISGLSDKDGVSPRLMPKKFRSNDCRVVIKSVPSAA